MIHRRFPQCAAADRLARSAATSQPTSKGIDRVGRAMNGTTLAACRLGTASTDGSSSVSELDHSDFNVIARGTFKGALVKIRTTRLDPGKPHLCPAFQAGRTFDVARDIGSIVSMTTPQLRPSAKIWSRDDGVTLGELCQSTESTDDAEPPFGVVGLLGRAWRSWGLPCPAQGSPRSRLGGFPALAGSPLVSERVRPLIS